LTTKPWYKNSPHKKFSGKTYARVNIQQTKTLAKDYAKGLRDLGYNVRISEVFADVAHAPDNKIRRTRFWAIWVRKPRGK
jgi:hypothetical protein